MNLLDNLNFTSDKKIEKENLSDFRGGEEYDCCYLICGTEYMTCGADGTGNNCLDVEIPDEGCFWVPGNCSQCPDA